MSKNDEKKQAPVKKVEEDRKSGEEQSQVTDTFPVWKETKHTRSQHPGFC